MNGPRRVEVYEPDQPRGILHHGEQLLAPGVLRNPVQVEALYDPAVAQRSALRNLLQRHGYADLDAVRDEGRSKQSLTLVARLLKRRVGGMDADQKQRIQALSLEQLESLAEAVLDFHTAADLSRWLDEHGDDI